MQVGDDNQDLGPTKSKNGIATSKLGKPKLGTWSYNLIRGGVSKGHLVSIHSLLSLPLKTMPHSDWWAYNLIQCSVNDKGGAKRSNGELFLCKGESGGVPRVKSEMPRQITYLPKPQFWHLYNWDNNSTYFLQLWGINKIMQVKNGDEERMGKTNYFSWVRRAKQNIYVSHFKTEGLFVFWFLVFITQK